ncbi:MAG: O-antigen ligase family protein [Thermacetogeniaceae bacterium]|jgi:O-antigen ligase
MSVVALTDRWGRLFSESALGAVFRGSLLYRLMVGRAEFLALCLITLLMPFIPVTASAVLILAAGLLFMARGRWRTMPAWGDMLRLPLLGPMLVFLAVMLLLSAFSVTRRESLEITVLFGIYMAFYLMCLAELKDKRKIYALTVIFLVSVALEACFGLYQNFITKPPVDPSWIDSVAFPNIMVRVFGTLDNPNILAQYLVPGIVLGLALALWKGRLSTRVLFLGLAGVAGASLVYTWTRMGWLSLGVAIVVFLLFYDWRLLLLAATGVVVAAVLRPDLLSSRLTSVLNLSQDSSMFYRFQIWQVAAHMIRDFWFSGVGPGSAAFQLVYNKFYEVYGMRAYHTHNLYIELLVEYGVFGTLIFLWLLCSYFGYALKRIMQSPGFARMAGMAAMAGMASYLFMGLTEDCWFNFKLVFLFWFLISLTVASARLPEERPGAAALGDGGAED